MTIDELTLEEKNEIGRIFLGFINSYQYKKALEYYGKLNNEAQGYIRTEGNCNWGLLIAVNLAYSGREPKRVDDFRLKGFY